MDTSFGEVSADQNFLPGQSVDFREEVAAAQASSVRVKNQLYRYRNHRVRRQDVLDLYNKFIESGVSPGGQILTELQSNSLDKTSPEKV
ncbi:MAG: hypothetical protein ACOY4Q_08320 [Bacillota bacterium]